MFFTKLLFLFHFAIVTVLSESIGEAISNYFNNETVQNFQNEWKKYKMSYDSALRLVLNDVYSRPAINQYVRKDPEFYKLVDAYYISDNVVDLFLDQPTLRELPRAIMPMASFALASNVLLVDADLGKMFVDTAYTVFRDESALVYEEPGTLKSPFTYQQVLQSGDLTIVAEECRLTASMVLTMNEMKVSIGHSTASLENCKFTVEIYNPGFKSPPVIAPYFSAQRSEELMRLLSNPIRSELLAKMQASVLNYPATLQFTDKNGRAAQRELVKSTRDYMVKVVTSLNKLTIQRNRGILPIKSFSLNLGEDNGKMRLEMSVRGLDSAYSSHTGGPFKFKDLQISEAITFDRLKVDGKAYMGETFNQFTADFVDVSVDVMLRVSAGAVALDNVTTSGWRFMEFSEKKFQKSINSGNAMSMEQTKENSVALIVIAYLSSELPKSLNTYLTQTIPDVLETTESQVGSQPPILGSESVNLKSTDMSRDAFDGNEDPGLFKSYPYYEDCPNDRYDNNCNPVEVNDEDIEQYQNKKYQENYGSDGQDHENPLDEGNSQDEAEDIYQYAYLRQNKVQKARAAKDIKSKKDRKRRKSFNEIN